MIAIVLGCALALIIAVFCVCKLICGLIEICDERGWDATDE